MSIPAPEKAHHRLDFIYLNSLRFDDRLGHRGSEPAHMTQYGPFALFEWYEETSTHPDDLPLPNVCSLLRMDRGKALPNVRGVDMRETELSPVVGYPGNVETPFSWDHLRLGLPDLVVLDDLVEFLERIGTTKTSDVVFQASKGMANALKLCRMLKQHTNAVIHLVGDSPTAEEIALAADFGIRSVHDASIGYHRLTEVIRENRLRASTSKSSPELVIGTIRIDVGRRKIFVGSCEMPTTKTEFEILTALGQHPGEIVTRQELIEHVWGSQWFGAPNVLDTHITHLRAKLLEAGCGTPVMTVRGVGFYIEPPQTPSIDSDREFAASSSNGQSVSQLEERAAV